MAPPVYAKRMWRKQTMLVKPEATYGTDAAPLVANAVRMTDTTFTPIEGEEVERDYYLPWLGHQGILPVGLYASIQCSVDLAGSGAAGTAPAFAALLRACAMAEVITAATSAVYTPVSSAFESVSIYFNLDGVRHVLLGARGTFTCEPTPKQIPRLKFTMTGLLGAITDAVLPAPNFTAVPKALPVSKANTPLTIGGIDQIAESFSFDLGNQVEPRMLIGEESIQIVDRKAKGQIVVEAVPVATKNWFADYQAATLMTLHAQHGTVAGNIVEIDAPGTQLGKPSYGNTQGVTNTTIPLFFTPVTGNDELKLTFR